MHGLRWSKGCSVTSTWFNGVQQGATCAKWLRHSTQGIEFHTHNGSILMLSRVLRQFRLSPIAVAVFYCKHSAVGEESTYVG